ncbi:hypothetical protein FIBSPDRAFT_131421 [Athelia psychrophila]|uniref:Uncharacterized protein n=1 Tax=Athelia psychrophila TaxID=1759441 RepID=A0A166CCU5_9AGAM|nr:hypothetical protein FIBSPDRAFT_131421 [Fibularhizoctonia sp. CBS 109695]
MMWMVAEVVARSDWEGGRCDTMWLELEPEDAVRIGTEVLKPKSRQGWMYRKHPRRPGRDCGQRRLARYSTSPSPHLDPTWIQSHLRCEEARLHRAQRLSHTQTRFRASSCFSRSCSRSSEDSSLASSRLAHLTSWTYVAAALKGKIVVLHPAV